MAEFQRKVFERRNPQIDPQIITQETLVKTPRKKRYWPYTIVFNLLSTATTLISAIRMQSGAIHRGDPLNYVDLRIAMALPVLLTLFFFFVFPFIWHRLVILNKIYQIMNRLGLIPPLIHTLYRKITEKFYNRWNMTFNKGKILAWISFIIFIPLSISSIVQHFVFPMSLKDFAQIDYLKIFGL